jgi:uncharacterized DUF497 family protein
MYYVLLRFETYESLTCGLERDQIRGGQGTAQALNFCQNPYKSSEIMELISLRRCNKKTIKNYKNPGGKNNNVNVIKELAFC